MRKLILILFSIAIINLNAAINPNTRAKSSSSYFREHLAILDSYNYYTDKNTQAVDGKIVDNTDFKPINGPFVQRDYNLNIQSIKNYKNGVMDGRNYYFSIDGTLARVVEYRNGEKEGEELSFHPSGYSSVISSYKNNLLDGTKYEFNENGGLILATEYNNGKKHGHEIKFSEGKVIQEDIYKNGQRHGKTVSYNNDGSLKAEGIYRNNFRDKEWKWYYPASEGRNVVRLIEVYENGNIKEITGLYPDGSKERKAVLVNGNGDFEQYYSNGAIKFKGKFKNYSADGTWTFYDLRGVPTARTGFNLGRFQY